MIPFRPIQDRIICRKCAQESVRPSGIVIPKTADARDEAEVIAVGPGRMLADSSRRPMTVSVGDVIVFPESRGQAFVYDGMDYIVLNEEHVIARIVDGADLGPLNDYVVAVQIMEWRIGSVYLPDSLAADRDEAMLIACGPGAVKRDGTLEPMRLQVGDRVLYNRTMRDEFRRGDERLLAFREEHVLCVVDREQHRAAD